MVFHQGEFLPVLAWRDLQGCKVGSESPMALAILRFRLAMPLDRLGVTLDLGPDIWRKPAKMDPWHSWINAVGRIGGRDLPRMDVDRLLALLRGFRDGR